MPTVDRRANALAVGLVLIGLAVRLPGLLTDFWLDEIWSYRLIFGGGVSGWVGLFTELHHSNNHHLVSLWMYLLGPDVAYVLYRLPAILCGGGALWILYLRWRRSPGTAPLITLTLFALCLPYVYYASEARGYMPAIFCILGAWALIEEEERWGWKRFLLYGGLLSAGVLWHLTTILVVPAFTLYIWVRRGGLGRRWLPAGLSAVAWQLPLIVTYGFLYLVDLRHTSLGTSDSYRQETMASEAFMPWLLFDRIPVLINEVLGLGWTGWTGLGAAGIILGLLAVEMVRSVRRGEKAQALWILALVATPAVLLIGRGEVRLFARYNLVVYALLLIPFGRLAAAALGSRRRWLQWSAMAGLALVGVNSGVRLGLFAQAGRGGYAAAVERMAAYSDRQPNGSATVNGDYDFRQEMIVSFHAERLPEDQRVVYVRSEELATIVPDWFIVRRPQAEVFGYAGGVYRLDSDYPAYGYSGERWYLFHRESP